MTDREKHKLSTELESLLGELPENIVDFLKSRVLVMVKWVRMRLRSILML
ncbi:hypothetical protein Godav_015319 [Gossypium davidsonii]|uniref:NET domain-containing protein n=1 Tax=Gossypium davidsonii TaxID=34287 RepID=A0A7J8RMR1_GOSDV|nr:hypothetical protein [Gossypium davidsonii]